jgi:hypothetical protein
MDPRSRPDGEPQDDMSLFTSRGQEEVLITIKSAHNMCSQEGIASWPGEPQGAQNMRSQE